MKRVPHPSLPRRPHRRLRALAATSALLALGLSLVTGSALAASDPLPEALDLGSSFTSTDNGDGTYTVPVLASDVPDVSVEMVPAAENDEGRDIYYMVSTTMHLSPGAPIMKSYDLVNWETVNYVFSRFDISDDASLRNGQSSYGQGQWASSLRYHDGKYYVAMNSMNLGGAFVYVTDDIENGAWEKITLGRGFHDLSLFFDVDGTPYFFYGGKEMNAVQLSPDLREVVAEYDSVIDVDDYPDVPGLGQEGLGPEGAQVAYIDGQYYIATIIWPPGGGRQVALFRSPELLGRYAQSPDGSGENTYEAQIVLDSDGFAQGSLVPVTGEDGATDWHGFFFRDTYPLGRIPALLPATWQDGWPDFGSPTYGSEIDKPIRLDEAEEQVERLKSVVASDDFDNDGPHLPFVDQQFELPDVIELDEELLGVNLVENSDFEDGLSPWVASGGADVEVVDDDGSQVALVTQRPAPGAGPSQDLAGKLQAGAEYDVSMRVRYDDGPSQKEFLLTVELGDGYVNLGSVTVTRGEWAQLSGTYRVADTRDVSTARLFVETPWTPEPTADDLFDYVADDVSVVGSAGDTEHPVAGEITPNGSLLDLAWGWNHNPDNRYWSLTDRDGWLRLTNGRLVTGEGIYTKMSTQDDLTYFEETRNTLSQRTFGPTASAETKLDITGMVDGDVAGLAVYTRSFTYAAVERGEGGNTLGIVLRPQPFSSAIDHDEIETFLPGTTVDLGDAEEVWIKADADFARANGELWVDYHYSTDGQTWHQLGSGPQGPLTADWSLSHFMGYRFGIFSYATETVGGHVDVDYYYLSDRLTAGDETVAGSVDRLSELVSAARDLVPGEYPVSTWDAVERATITAEAALAAGVSTHNQADAPRLGLARALAQAAVEREAPAPVAELAVADVDFGTHVLGDDLPAPRPVVISNDGTAGTTITAVSLGEASAFELSGGDEAGVGAGEENTSWSLRPVAGLESGEYVEVVTVSDGGTEVTGVVSLVVVAGDEPGPEVTAEPTAEPTDAVGPPDPSDSDLPSTGAQVLGLGLLGVLLAVAGAVLVARRRARG